MKAKDWFLKKNTQAKIKNEDFDKFLEGIKEDQEIPDVWVNLFDENFLTRDRAAADFEISKKIKAESLNGVDEKFKAILPLLDATDREALEKEINTYKKVESLPGAFQRVLDKLKTANPSNDEKIKEYEKTVSELAGKIKTINSERETEKTTLQKQFEEREKTMRVDWALQNKFGEFTFADEFSKPEDKKAIIELMMTKVKSGNTLALDDKGQILVQETVNGVAKPKYNGNDQVTIDSLLAEPLKPFLKKNNGDGGSGQQQQQRQQQAPRVPHQNGNGQQINLPPKARANTPTV